jgi:hypothetical protein
MGCFSCISFDTVIGAKPEPLVQHPLPTLDDYERGLREVDRSGIFTDIPRTKPPLMKNVESKRGNRSKPRLQIW